MKNGGAGWVRIGFGGYGSGRDWVWSGWDGWGWVGGWVDGWVRVDGEYQIIVLQPASIPDGLA
jgi:hypothetical protein